MRRPAAGRPIAAITTIVGVIVAFLFAIFVTSPKGQRAESSFTPLLGKPAPTAEGATLDGSTFSLSSRRGSWVALNFFSSTCTPCRNEHPALAAFVDSQAGLPVERRTELATVVFSDSVTNVREFFAQEGGGWPVLLDKDGRAVFAFGVTKVPETWIIDPAGVVRKRLITQVTAISLQAELDALRAAT